MTYFTIIEVFIVGAIFGILAILLCIHIMSKIDDIKLKKELGEDYKYIFMSKSYYEKMQKCMNLNYVEDKRRIK